jgi:hypothetical protein
VAGAKVDYHNVDSLGPNARSRHNNTFICTVTVIFSEDIVEELKA